MKNKHGNHPVAASNPHPYVHPYLNNNNQQPNTYPQPKYKFVKKMLSPNTKSLEKLANPQVSIHEKRKTLQKSQVGDGLLQTATHLMLPLIRQALNI